MSYKLFMSLQIDIFETAHKVNTPTLTHVYRLYDKGLRFFLAELVFEVGTIGWQLPCFWKEVVIILAFLSHTHEIFR